MVMKYILEILYNLIYTVNKWVVRGFMKLTWKQEKNYYSTVKSDNGPAGICLIFLNISVPYIHETAVANHWP